MLKKFLLLNVLILTIVSLSGCERNDYQHPMHRNGSK